MKKICFITTVSSTLEGFVLPFAKFLLNETDWDIYMICDRDDDFEEILPKEIKYIPIPMKRGISLGGIKAMLEMRKIFRKERFDLIQYSTPNASLYAALAGKMARIPVRLYCQWGLAYVGMEGIKRTIFKQIEKVVCSLSTWIEPDSNSNLRFAHAEKLYNEEKGAVIGSGSACGVKLEKFNIKNKDSYRENIRKKYGISEDAFVFGFVGRITRDKGINELLQAIRVFLDKYPEVYLVNLGAEDGIETIEQCNYQWSVKNKNVIYTGMVDNVEEYLSAMDCYILPSYREGFGMGTIEAEAMEVPVIVTNIPGPIDAMIKDVTGKVIPKKDWESLYNAMVEIFTLTKEERKKMGAEGRKFVINNFEQNTLCQLLLQDRKNLLKD